MRFLVLGNILGNFNRFKEVWFLLEETIPDFDAVLLTGNFGPYKTLKETLDFVSKRGYESISVYGEHDDYFLKRELKKGYLKIGLAKLLPLGGVERIKGFKILGIGGMKGRGRNWYEWRDKTIFKIIERNSWKSIDLVLSYDIPRLNEEPYLIGRYSLRRLIDELEPKFFVFGREMGAFKPYNYEDKTLIVPSGNVSSLNNNSSAVIIDTAKGRVDFHGINTKKSR